MALTDEIAARFTNQKLVELTQLDNTSATTVDSTKLAQAASDAKNEFQRVTGLAYDETDSTHHTVGWLGVVYYLLLYGGRSSGESLKEWEARWRSALESFRSVSGDDRILPVSTSGLSPSRESDRHGSGTVRPDFDRLKMRRFMYDGRSGALDDDVA